MKFEGNNTRKLTGQKQISFLLNNAGVSNLTGDVSIGFSGEGKSMQFTFNKGRIYDTSGYYVHSYDPSLKFSISGDISENYYDYYIDNVIIGRGKAKEDFKIEDFFINTNNCYLEANLKIFSDGVPYAFTTPSSVTLGTTVTAQMENLSTDGTIHIFDVTLKGKTSTNYTLQSYPSAIAPQETKDFVLNNIAGIQGNHAFNLDLDTSIGKISIEDRTDATEADLVTVWNELREFEAGASQAFDFSAINSEEIVTFIYETTIVGGTDYQKVLPTLEYVEGNIGKYYRITEVQIIDAGEGYTGNASAVFSNGQGNDIQAEGVVEMNAGTVSSVSVTNSGIYFDIPPTLTFSGDLDSNNSSAHQAQATITVEEYNKTFTETWDMYVGVGATGSVISYKDSNYTGNQGENAYAYTTYGPGIYENANKYTLLDHQPLYIKIQGKSFYDYDQMKVKLKVTGDMADTRENKLVEEIEITGGNTT